jgi:CDGSH-type Zn-finger protein
MAEEIRVRVRPNGPLVIEAPVTVVDHNGAPFPVNKDKPVVALCRCGASANKPFCDGAHNKIGFQADNTAPAPEQLG